MTEQEVAQLRRDVEDLFGRMRQVESLEAPFLKSVYERFMRLIARVEVIEAQSNPILIRNLAEDVQEIKEDQKAVRATVRSALITAGASIFVQLVVGAIIFAVLRAR